MAEITNQYRGKVDIIFLGNPYTLMKPSFKHNLFMLFERRSEKPSTSVETVNSGATNDAQQVKEMILDSLGKEVGETKDLTKFVKSIVVDSLAICIQKEGALLKAGLTIELTDDSDDNVGKGFGKWFRVKKVKAEFLRDTSGDPNLDKLIKESLLEYIKETQDEATIKKISSTLLAIGQKIESGEELTEEDNAELENAKKASQTL